VKVAFLDRDGVINEEVGYLHEADQFKYTYKCIEALHRIKLLGYKLAIVSNQAGIGKGIFTIDQYHTLSDHIINDLKSNGVEILETMFCPHIEGALIQEFDLDCSYRKPKPGMINFICDKYSVDRSGSFLVGDKLTDGEAGIAAGIGEIYLVRSGHRLPGSISSKFKVFEDLYHVSKSLND